MSTDKHTDIDAGSGFQPRHLPVGQLALPDTGMVHAWYLDLSALGNPLHMDDSDPPPALNARQQRTLRRFYLRLILGGYLGCPGKDVHIQRSPRGKPHLAETDNPDDLCFSTARSDGRCLVTVSSGNHVGVDLEPAERNAGDPLALARRYFSPAEARALESYEGETRQRAFIHTWACKEAIVKASGLGIANQLCRFTVSTDPDAPPALLEAQNGFDPNWSLAVVRPEPGYIGAIALNADGISVQGFRLLPPPHTL